MRLLVVSTLLTAGAAAQVAPDRLLNAVREPQNWLTYSGTYLSQRHTALDQITPANVKNLELQWVFQAQSLEKFARHPARRRRRHVRDAGQQQRGRPRRQSGARLLGLPTHPPAGPEALLRLGQSRARDPRRRAVHGDARLAAGRARRADGPSALEDRRRRLQSRLLPHAGAARHQGQGPDRDGRRRVRHPRVRRRLRCPHRQGSVALQCHSVPRGARSRDVEERCLEVGRRVGMAHRLVRPRAQPDLLGDRESRPGHEHRAAAGRQPVYGFTRGARCRHRGDEVVLPVHPERRRGLGRRAGSGARRTAPGTAARASFSTRRTATGSSTCSTA